MRLQAANASAFALTNTTPITAMRITAVRACAVYFHFMGKGIAADGANVTGRVYRDRTGGTDGGPITPTKLDSREGEATTTLATFLDVFSVEPTAGTLVDTKCFHPQFDKFSDLHYLAPGEKLDASVVGDAAITSKVHIRAVVRDLV